MENVNEATAISLSQEQANNYGSIATIIRALVELMYNRDISAEIKTKIENKMSLVLDKIK